MFSQGLPEIKCRYDAYGIPYLKTATIDAYAAELLRQYKPIALTEPMPLEATHFLESYLDLRVELVHIVSLREDDPILGATSFNDESVLPVKDAETGRERLIYLDRGDVAIEESLYDEAAYQTESGVYVRANFTGFHEAGHWLLHQRHFTKNIPEAEYLSEHPDELDETELLCCYRSTLNQDKPFDIRSNHDRMEYQANAFAGCITMPHNVFLREMRQEMRVHGVYKGAISRGTDSDLDILADELMPARASEVFGVSKASARKRLAQVGLVAGSGKQYSYADRLYAN